MNTTPKSPLASKTIWWNALMSIGTIITVLNDSALVKTDPNLAHLVAGAAGVWGTVSIILRFFTHRPVDGGKGA